MRCGLVKQTLGPDRVFYTGLSWPVIMHWPGISRFLECEAEAIHAISAAYASALNEAPYRETCFTE